MAMEIAPLGNRRPLRWLVDPDVVGLLALLLLVVVVFGATADNFLTASTFTSVAFQLPELGLLTLAMLVRHFRQLLQARALLDLRLPLDGGASGRLSAGWTRRRQSARR